MKLKSLITGLECDLYVLEIELCFLSLKFQVASFSFYLPLLHTVAYSVHLTIYVGNAFNVEIHLISFTPKESLARLHSSLPCPGTFIFFCHP